MSAKGADFKLIFKMKGVFLKTAMIVTAVLFIVGNVNVQAQNQRGKLPLRYVAGLEWAGLLDYGLEHCFIAPMNVKKITAKKYVAVKKNGTIAKVGNPVLTTYQYDQTGNLTLIKNVQTTFRIKHSVSYIEILQDNASSLVTTTITTNNDGFVISCRSSIGNNNTYQYVQDPANSNRGIFYHDVSGNSGAGGGEKKCAQITSDRFSIEWGEAIFQQITFCKGFVCRHEYGNYETDIPEELLITTKQTLDENGNVSEMIMFKTENEVETPYVIIEYEYEY